ncbi:gfo/Idh/MocA family oxidoreductase [bacterium]|nr:gfo/Idh/MocA family oxidoreductase [bacterium]
MCIETDQRFLVVSLGSIGRRHLRNLRALRPQSLIGVLRLTSSGANEELPECADLQFTSVNDALAFAPSAAIIASPASTHLAVAMPLARAGVPLLIEKPLATSCAGLDELLAAAAEIPLMVAYNLRFLPSLIEARRLIHAGAIGEVLAVRAEVGQYLPTWRPASRYQNTVSARQALGGGALLELSHEFDYLYWMFGLPTRVTASGGRYSALEIDVEDLVSVNLEYEAPRRLVHVHLDLLQRATTRGCKFIGSEGTLRWDGIADTLECYTPAAAEWRCVQTRPCADRNEMYVAELAHFLQCVARGGRPLVDLRAAHDVLAIVDAARASIAGQCSIKVKAHGKD